MAIMLSHLHQTDNKNNKPQLVSGWLSSVKQIASPNFNQRPDIENVSLLVIHNISLPPEQFGEGYIQQFFCNQLDSRRHPYFRKIATVEVSSHFLITRKGEIIQFVSTEQRAWHAGESHFEGCDNCNDFSIGIELEGADAIPYTYQQYESLSQLSLLLMQYYPKITRQRMVGHSNIAPQRKTDPGPAFDWQRFYGLVNTVVSKK